MTTTKRGPRRNQAQIEVDKLVGKRMMHRRILVGLSQEELGDRIGITFQQVQKYESGMNRISASRLWDLSKALGVSVSYFFSEESATEDRSTSDLKFAGYVDKLGKAERGAVLALIHSLNASPVIPSQTTVQKPARSPRKPRKAKAAPPVPEPVQAAVVKLSRSGHVTHINGRRIV